MGGLGDEHALLAKARAAGSPPSDVFNRVDRLKGSGIKAEQPPNFLSWREAAKSVDFNIQSAYPRIHNFERSVLPSIRTLRAQFKCGLCKYCQRPMIESLLPQHMKECESRAESKQGQKQQQRETSKLPEVEEEPASNAGTTKKKRKAGDEAASRKGWRAQTIPEPEEEPPAKRVKIAKTKNSKATKPSKQTKTTKSAKPPKQTKQAKEKPVAVYHPDKNCGVLLPSAQPCMRSLTCKQHSMGAKRAVAGRSASYDVLLSNYHRQHQVKQAQMTASAAQAAQMESDQLQEAQAQQNPEREVHQVLEGVSRVYCAPLAKGQVARASSRSANFRLREMLAVALLPRRLPPTGDVLYGRSLAFRPEAPEQLTYIRSQPVQQAMYISQLQQRQLQMRRQAEAGMAPNAAAGSNGGLRPGMQNVPQSQSPSPAQQQHQYQAEQPQHQQQLSARLSAQQQLQHRLSQSHNRNSA